MRSERAEQPIDLPAAHAHQRRGVVNARAPICQIDQNLQPRGLLAAHRDHHHPPPPRAPEPKTETVTSQSVRRVTSLSVIYSVFAPKEYYAKFI